MAAFVLAVLLRPSRSDVAHADAELLARQRKHQWELGPVVDLDLANLERKRRGQLADEREARAVGLASIQAQHPHACAVRRVLEPFGPATYDDLYVDLDGVPGRSFSKSVSCFGRRRRVFTRCGTPMSRKIR